MKSKRRFMHGRRRRRSPLRSIEKDLSDETLDTSFVDAVYRVDRVNKTLKEMGYDPNTRKKDGKKTTVRKIDKRMDDDSIVGSQVFQAPDDYL